MAVPKLKTIVPYLTYVMLWLVMFFLASEFIIPRENVGFTAKGSDTAPDLMKTHLWNKELIRTAMQLLLIPGAVFGALLTGRMSARGLFATTLVLFLSINTYVAWVFDSFVPRGQTSFFSIQGLLEYQYWEFFIWQLAVNTVVPVLALAAIRHLTSRSSETPAVPLD